MASATTIENLRRTFTATVTIEANNLVVLDVDKVNIATVTTDQTVVGFAERGANAGDEVPVILLNGGGTAYAKCAVTISAGDIVYAASGGAISTVTTDAGSAVGSALMQGDPDDVIEVLLA